MAGRYVYQAEVSHKGLHKYRVVKAATRHELEQKTKAIMAQWDDQWDRIVEREERKRDDEDSESYAKELTQQAENLQTALDRIILDSIIPTEPDAEMFKDYAEFSEPYPIGPILKGIPRAPCRTDRKYNSKPSLLIKLSKKRMSEFEKLHTAEFEQDYAAWEIVNKEAKEYNDLLNSKYELSVKEWEKRKTEYERDQAERNQKIDLLFEEYAAGKPLAIEQYLRLALEQIQLPFSYNRSVEIEYVLTAKMVIVDIFLPTIDDIPKLKSVSYIKSKKEFKEAYYSDSYIKKKYDSILYQIILQTLNYIFYLSSKHEIIDSVAINGRINTIDKATGKEIEPYILSISISRQDFNEINLECIDPVVWFKKARGVSAASLANITPIAPIVMMSREDDRFVEGYSVADKLNAHTNLAAMDWQDFENLIREVFEKEFNQNGGEVKITQASRDGGVDAIAFDPDPIRGGKIIIQAKRYTNVVGVSAVRDLYGTVLNEGATKGILVTTSNYGNDAYKFAQKKPLTLMNGANLLYLLEKHGYKASIDLMDAKRIST